MALTVGQVSGLIAAAVTLIHLIFPNALVIVLVGLLGNEHNAVTWSVAQRSLSSSLWPSLLRTDASTGRSVNIGVRLLSLLSRFGLLMIAIAATVTPLGLHEAIVPTNGNVAVPFSAFQDTSPMGIGTPARSNDRFTRICGSFGPIVCPGSKTQINYTLDPDDNTTATDYDVVGTYDAMVPAALIELYQSGLNDQPETVSSFFDIQTRQYTKVADPQKEDGRPFLVDSFRMLEPLILNDAIEAKEGLIVDTKQGQVGFRHHMTPSHVGEGAEWSEDLLFLEPITECVDTNLTLEFKIPEDGSLGSSGMSNLTLIDNGGFSNLIQEYPQMNVTTSQEDPQLRFRAYKAAWIMNVYSMLIMNITRPNPDSFGYLNSEPGQRWEIAEGFGSPGSANAISVDTLFSSLVDPTSNAKSNSTNSVTNETSQTGIYDNPFNITSSNYSDISLLCHGAGGRDNANASNIFVQCGLVYGAARRTDGVETLIFEPGDVYQQSVYSCASATRASIKSVTMKYNATAGDSLKALTISNISEKAYSANDGPNPPPLWGIETVDIALSDIQQLWGLIDESYKDDPNVTAIRAPHLHLPGYSLSSGPPVGLPGVEFIPGATAVSRTLAGMYGGMSSSGSGAYDYTGQSNLALFQKWQGLSTSIDGVAKMLNLVWADTAANYLQGTRGWGSGKVTDASGGNPSASRLKKRQSDNGNQSVMVPVQLYEKKIQYHWVYAIPAFIVLATFLCVMAASCCCMLLRSGPKRTRYYLNHLSAGRLLAEQRYPGAVDKQVSTATWIKMAGKYPVALKDGHGYGPAAQSLVGGGGGGGGGGVAGTPGGSPYTGPDGFDERKPGGMASSTELSSLNPVERQINGQGYMRVH